jgi:Asp-tRNA(Asn)/Glu-tRNA(Gln) amidotransferase A subunit family amidase
MARTVRDAALVLGAIAGYDPEDPGSVDRPVDDYLSGIEEGVSGLRVALPRDAYFARADDEVLAAVAEAARVLERAGARLEQVDLSWIEQLPEEQSILLGSDAAAFHAQRLADRADEIGADVRERLRRGAARTGTAVAAARRFRSLAKRDLARILDDRTVLLLPATPIAAPPRAGQDALAAAARLTAYTAPFNFTGVPAISVPCGFTRAGLPIGLQLVAGAWREALVLRAARAYERTTDWPRLAPL